MKENNLQNLKINVFNKNGEIVSYVDLPAAIFDEPFNKVLLHECYEYARNKNRGLTTACTKSRHDLNYSTRKLRAQKRTGRARIGGKGAPHHRHGAVAHGPNGSDYSYKFNKKKIILGVLITLSQKLRENKIMIMDELSLNQINTKGAINLMENLKIKISKVLFMPKGIDKSLLFSIRNIPTIDCLDVEHINLLSIINKDIIILTRESLNALMEKYGVLAE